jgi:hypothetical protein
MTDLNKNLNPIRPKPFSSDIELIVINRRVESQDTVEALLHGDFVLVKDFYSTGLTILAALKKHLTNIYSDQHLQDQRDFRSIFREASQRLLLMVRDNKLLVRKAPDIGWLSTLYPDMSDFLLSFPDVQGLNSSWQWYEKGILIPVLKKRLHPYYGIYFPTRFDHLELFAGWLKNYKDSKKTAIDIGTGCGILTFQLLQCGFEKVYATDINVNAIIGVREEIKRMNLNDKLILHHGDLFGTLDIKSELIVFNPPWLPSAYNPEGIDKAIYYDKDLFPRFFAQAHAHLETNGKLVMLFSNLAQSAGGVNVHPIKEELLSGGRFKKDMMLSKSVSGASKKTKRNLSRRKDEMVELWVLSLK